MVTYGTTAIPSDSISVQAGGTVDISAAFENSIGLIGGMDTANGSASTGSVVTVDSPSDAQDKFGDGSELDEAVSLAFSNGAGKVTALPVVETTVTAETQSSATGTLDNAPIFDPNVNNEHSITVADSGGGTLDVVIYYGDPTTNQPSDADTIRVNPVTGQYGADAAPDGTNYEFDYDYGDYSTAELAKMVDESPRIIGLLNENTSVVSDIATEVGNAATDFDFMHVVAGADPAVVSGSVATSTEADTYASNYTDSIDDRRVSLVASPRAYIDSGNSDMQRTVSAVGGYLASLPLGISATNDSIGGFTDLRTPLRPSNASDLIDEQVMPLIDYPPITIAKDMTTSTTTKFERVYSNQVVDEATEVSHRINRNFVGDQNTTSTRGQLATSHRNAYNSFRSDTPPLLDDFTVNVSEDPNDPNKVNVEIGLNVVDVLDTIDVTITVGDIIRNAGAN